MKVLQYFVQMHLATKPIISCLILLIFLLGCQRSSDMLEPSLVKAKVDQSAANESQEVEQGSTKFQKGDSVSSESHKALINVSAFGDAALEGNIQVIREALSGGINVNAADDQHRTALMLAAFNGHTPIVKLLLDQGASVDARDVMGRTALMFAATGDNAETVKLLVESGAEVNAVDSGEKFTSLMHAAAEGQLEVVRILLEHKADPTLRDIDGDSALDFASRNGHSAVEKLLAE